MGRASQKTQPARRSRNRGYIWGYKAASLCADCGERDPLVLEFDHVRGVKEYNIGDMASSNYAIETIQNEIDKCEVVCANCHRLRTYSRRKKLKSE